MFTDNKYKKWYDAIVENAKSQNRNLDYFENHHIIPKSLGGSDDSSNIVKLSAREHFICHFLLTKFTSGHDYQKMIYACQGMRRSRKYQNRYINARLYEIVKREAANIQSQKFLGKKLTPEHRSKISASLTGKKHSPETVKKRKDANTGLKRTDAQKLTMSLKQKELVQLLTEEEKKIRSKKISSGRKGISSGPKTDEHKAKLSQSLLGKTKGIPKSEETKQKMRKPKSEAHRKAISEARKLKYALLRQNNN